MADTPQAERMSERSAVEELIALLDLEPIEVNIFRGTSPQDRSQRVFGGQVLGQALVAASRTVEDRLAHSLHAYFLLPGDPKVPILYEVDRSRDGKSFSSRRVVAIQHGRPIFHMSVSFDVAEAEQLEHQIDAPNVPHPDSLPSEEDMRRKMIDRVPEQYRDHFLRPRPIQIKPVGRMDIFKPEKLPPQQAVWIKATDTLPDDVSLQQCVLAYASDMTLLDTALLPHGIGWFDDKIQMASIDHAMWFHRPFRADQWLLYVQDSPSAFGARGFNRGTIYTEGGTLVASVAQEGLMRLRKT
ncbi:MAG: acyl-CoA thioesterase II [Proteobacteria bacterium]|nr:acyl-CoA thioesterase II [Pseudomonadota bacterium]